MIGHSLNTKHFWPRRPKLEEAQVLAEVTGGRELMELATAIRDEGYGLSLIHI